MAFRANTLMKDDAIYVDQNVEYRLINISDIIKAKVFIRNKELYEIV